MKPLQLKTTSTLRDLERNIAKSMKTKKSLIRKSAFPKPPFDSRPDPNIKPGTAHITITKDIISQVLLGQLATKASGLHKINFQILRMI